MPTKTFLRLDDDKRETVLRAAIAVFVRNGYVHAKVGDIAKSAGIAKGSIYQYFAGKRELFIYCAQWGLEVFMKKMDARMGISTMDIFDYVGYNGTDKFSVVLEESELAAFMQVVMNDPEISDDTMRHLYDVGGIYTLRFIQNGKRKGTVRSDISDEVLLEFILGATERLKRRWWRLYIVDLATFQKDSARTSAMMEEVSQLQELLRRGMGT